MASLLAAYFLSQLDNAKRDVVQSLVDRMMALTRVTLVLASPACCRHEKSCLIGRCCPFVAESENKGVLPGSLPPGGRFLMPAIHYSNCAPIKSISSRSGASTHLIGCDWKGFRLCGGLYWPSIVKIKQ